MTPERFTELAAQVEAPPEVARVPYRFGVITAHGIRTTGRWQKQFGTTLSDNWVRPLHVDYGYRIPLLAPRKCVEVGVKDFEDHYREFLRWRLPVSAVGHSFGTLVIGRALELLPSVKLQRILLSSAILSPDFAWRQYHERGRVANVMNEHCPIDRVVPLSAGWKHWPFSLPTGRSGCDGFVDADGVVKNVHYRHVGHTRLPTPLHMENVWLPYLLQGDIHPGDA